MPHTSKMPVLALIGISLFSLASTVATRTITAISPGEQDAQLFMYIGNQWAQGQFPYTNIWDNKPPGLFALLAILFHWFPKNLIAVAVVEGAFVLLALLGVYLVFRKLHAPWQVTAISVVAASAATNLAVYNEHGILTEIYTLFPAIMSIVAFITAVLGGRLGLALIAGFLAGIASFFKTPGLSVGIAEIFFLIMLAFRNRVETKHRIAQAASICSGIAIFWGSAVAYFAYHGAAYDLLNASLLYNIRYGAASHVGLATSAALFLTRIEPVSTLAVSAIALFLQAWTRRAKTQITSKTPEDQPFFWAPLVITWIFFDVIGALAGGRYYPHYFLPITLSLSVAAGLFLWNVLDNHLTNKSVFATIGTLIIVPLFMTQAVQFGKTMNSTVGTRPKEHWKQVAERINAIKTPVDTLFVVGYHPGIYNMTGLKSPTRLLDIHYLGDSKSARNEFGKEMVEELSTKHPDFIIDDTESEANYSSGPEYQHIRTLIKASYNLFAVVHQYSIYVRKDRKPQKHPNTSKMAAG